MPVTSKLLHLDQGLQNMSKPVWLIKAEGSTFPLVLNKS